MTSKRKNRSLDRRRMRRRDKYTQVVRDNMLGRVCRRSYGDGVHKGETTEGIDQITWGRSMSEQGFIDALNENPYDWDTRLVYADWLEENGDIVLAQGQRWMAQHKKAPRETYFKSGEWTWERPTSWMTNNQMANDPRWKLPARHRVLWGRKYKSRKNAEKSLARQLVKFSGEGQ
jgi:uncharacterized protein (TIGR02996 family)